MANQTEQLAALLRSEGAAVEVVRTNAPYRPAAIAHMRGLRALFRLLPYLSVLWSATGRVRLVHVMANSGWSWHLFVAPAVWIARMRGKSVVVNYRGGEADAFFSRSWRMVAPTLARANAVFVPSGFLVEVFKRRGISPFVVPNIVDLSKFAARPKRYGDTRAPHVIVARNLEQIYDVETALRAFAGIHATCPGAHLTVAGSGPERESLERLAGELQIAPAVTFTGAISNDEIAALYENADLMLNSSRVDNMPISILEALASGVPVVSTDVGGIPYLVEDGEQALLVPPAAADRLAEAALRVLQDRRLRDHLTENGLRHVARFEWKNVRKALFQVYRSVEPSLESKAVRRS